MTYDADPMTENECESGLMNFIMTAIIVIIVCFVSGVAFGIYMARAG